MKKLVLFVMISCLGISPAILLNQLLVAAVEPLVAQTLSNDYEKAQDLLLQASQYVARDEKTKAAEILTQILQLTPNLVEVTQGLPESDFRGEVLYQIARNYAEIGQFEQALNVANTIKHDLWKTQAQQAIAYRYFDIGQASQAITIINTITDKFEQVRSLREIVSKYNIAGQTNQARLVLDQALEITQEIPANQTSKYVGYTQDNLLTWLAGDYAQIRQFEQAQAITNTIKDSNSKSEAQGLMAQGYLQAGQLDQAWQFTQTITNPSVKIQTLRELAKKYAKTGNLVKANQVLTQAFEIDKANQDGYGSFSIPNYAGGYTEIGQYQRGIELLNSLQDDYLKADARRAIAKAYFNLGNYAKALEIVKPIPNGILMPIPEYGDPKVELLGDITLKAAQIADYDLALEAANSLSEGDDRVYALRSIAKEYIKVGQKDKAADILNQAIQVAKQTEKVLIYAERTGTYIYASNARLFKDIASDYAAMGQKQMAMDVMKLALIQAQTEEDVSAKYSSNWSSPAIQKLETLNQIVQTSVELGFKDSIEEALSQALKMAPTLDDNSHSIQLLITVVNSSESTVPNLAAEILSQALQVVQKIENADAKLFTEAKIAAAYGQIGDSNKAVEILSQLLPKAEKMQRDPNSGSMVNFKRAQAFSEIAIAYAFSGKLHEALTLTNRIEVQDIRDMTLANLVQAYVKMGQLTQAIPIAQTIRNKDARSRALKDIPQVYLASGEPAKALPIAQIMWEDDQKAQTLAKVALAYAQANQPEVALPILSQALPITKNDFLDKRDRTTALGDIAISYAAAGKNQEAANVLSQALQIAQTIEFQSYPPDQMLAIITAAVKAEQDELALQVIPNLPDDRFKITALRQMAQLYHEVGKKQQAEAALNQAVQIAGKLNDVGDKERFLNAIAQQQQN